MSVLALVVATPRPWLADLDPRLRVVAALAFAGVVASLQDLWVLAGALTIALAVAAAAGLPARLLGRRLVALEGFMVVVLASLPFTVTGETLFAVGPLVATWEGLHRAVAIALRANAIVIMLLALAGTLDPAILGHALARLGVPHKLVHLFLLTVRYMGVMYDEYRRMRLAMRARAFTPGSNRHTWRTYGWLVGMLMVRSLERSRRILDAMRCRGFQGRLYLLPQERWRPRDSLGAMMMALLLGMLIALEYAR
ncbi:MAG: cobalt ECF transporter T component CbiQ [Gammaproteobacteria bacterium]|nr:cobalt ECF transporter T component CbiQ [Gammaproteobacteria bacterium]